MAQVNGNAPKITFYTNLNCPWAQRAQIVLKELGLPYEQVLIDLDKPREPWYLEINPRGLVPAISFNGEIITESAIVATFLADAYPSHILPASGSPETALTRARINFFIDTWNNKIPGNWYKMLMADSEEEKEKLSQQFLDVMNKEIEPLLKDAKPFLGGSEKITLAEALSAPFVLRMYGATKYGALPQSVTSSLDALPNFSKWAAALRKQESVTYQFNEKESTLKTMEKLESMRKKAKEAAK